MRQQLIVAPTSEPVSLDEAKAQCRVDAFDDDALIAGFILTARQWVEGQTHRVLMPQTLDFSYDYEWPCPIRLPLTPVQSVTVSYVDDAGATQTLSSSLYTAVLNGERPFITRAYNETWPSLRYVPNAVTVRAVCGYAPPASSPTLPTSMGDVPYPLRQAILLFVGHLYENREGAGEKAVEHDYSIEALISPYRWRM